MERLIFISPLLIDKKAHYYNAARALYSGTQSHDIDFIALICKTSTINETWVRKVFRVNPTLPFFTIKRLSLLFKKKQSTVAASTTLMKSGKKYSGVVKFAVDLIDVLNILYMNVMYFSDLRHALKSESMEDTSLYVDFPSKYMIFGLWMWLRLQKEKPHVFFNLTVPITDTPKFILKLFRGRANFLACSDNWSRVYTARTGIRIHNIMPAAETSNQTNAVSHTRKVFGIVGSFRLARGLATIAEMVRQTISDPVLCEKVQFVVQCSSQVLVDGKTRAILSQLMQLQEQSPDVLRIVSGELQATEYFELLNSIDVVLLPYSTAYNMRGSGVLIDALLCGKPVVLPFYIEPYDIFSYNFYCMKTMNDSAEEFMLMVRLLLEGQPYEGISKACNEYKGVLAKKHSPAQYITELLKIKESGLDF